VVVTVGDVSRGVPVVRGRWLRWARWAHTAGPWWAEAAVLVLIDRIYELLRSLAPTRVHLAFADAYTLEGIERGLHLNVELAMNGWLERTGSLLITPVSAYYQVGHLVALLGTLTWAWLRHRHRYAPARTALVGLTLAALVGYWLVPTAPPRLAMFGAIDTVAVHPLLLADQPHVVELVNAYAAMPSLHVAWAVWVALTVARLGGRWGRLAWLHPAATTLTVLATANHYVLDVVAGLALTVVAWIVVMATRDGPADEDEPEVIDVLDPPDRSGDLLEPELTPALRSR
jgi:uncharacterized membrane protein YkvA (DUF1232 family)